MKRRPVETVTDPGAALLAAVSRGLTPADLRAIAESDYGYAAAESLAALQRLARGDLAALRPLTGNPREVLELTRWSEPRADDLPGHRGRLFSCVALLIAAADPADAGLTCAIPATLLRAIASAQVALPDRTADLRALVGPLRGADGEEDEWGRALASLAVRPA